MSKIEPVKPLEKSKIEKERDAEQANLEQRKASAIDKIDEISEVIKKHTNEKRGK